MKDEPDTSLSQKIAKGFRERPIDGTAMKSLVESGLTWLRTNQQLVNSLNVFPVPDGDTGTNMVLTMQSAFDEIANSPERNFGKMAHSVAHGALMGARGNSGVILSQLWRGFARAVDNQDYLDAPSLARALAGARDTAYKGVVRPVEGTILTVAKDAAAAAEEGLALTNDPIALLDIVVRAADLSVQHTPELLPVLKEAGVVDSGGKGLFFILEGMLRFAYGQSLEMPSTTIQHLGAMMLENTARGMGFIACISTFPLKTYTSLWIIRARWALSPRLQSRTWLLRWRISKPVQLTPSSPMHRLRRIRSPWWQFHPAMAYPAFSPAWVLLRLSKAGKR